MFRILRNCFISEHRRKSVRPVETSWPDDSGDGDIASYLIEQSDDFQNWWAEPEAEFINQLLGAQIKAAIEGLPEVFRTTVYLVNVEGLSYDEAATTLGVPTGTVRSRMKRGRTMLQKALFQQAEDAGLTAAGTGGS